MYVVSLRTAGGPTSPTSNVLIDFSPTTYDAMGGVREVSLLFLAGLVVVGSGVSVSADALDEGPAGDYLVGPDAVGVEFGVREAGSTVATEVEWERTIGDGQTLTVDLAWEEVGEGSQIAQETTNIFNYKVLVNDSEELDDFDFSKTSFRTADQLTYTTPGDYTITLTGLQGITKYTMEITES